MTYGFDPGIILSGRQYTGPDANETMKTLSQLSLQGVQKQQGEAQIAEMLRQQGQQKTLADIYRQTGGDPATTLRSLYAGGFGEEAQKFGGNAAAQNFHNAEAQKQKAQALKEQQEIYARPLMGVKDDAGIAAAKQQWRQMGVPEEQLARMPDKWEQAEPLVRAIQSAAIPATDQAKLTNENKQKELDRTNRTTNARIMAGQKVTDTGTGQRMQFNPATGQYDIPVGDAKPPTGKSLTKGDRDSLEAFSTQASSAGELLGRFQDSYAGKGVVGSKGVEINQKLGSMASKEGQEEAAFWADFSKLIDLPERNKTFGASLTATEKSSWEGAKNIKPGADPKLVRAQLEKLQAIATKSMQRRGRSLAKDGYSAEAIEEFTGPLETKPPAPQSGGSANASAPAGFIKVSNGKETHMIDPKFEAGAASDGFTRVP